MCSKKHPTQTHGPSTFVPQHLYVLCRSSLCKPEACGHNIDGVRGGVPLCAEGREGRRREGHGAELAHRAVDLCADEARTKRTRHAKTTSHPKHQQSL